MALATHLDLEAQPQILTLSRCDGIFAVCNRVNLVVGLTHFQGQFICTEQEDVFNVWLLCFEQRNTLKGTSWLQTLTLN